jgi:hypothetical protein
VRPTVCTCLAIGCQQSIKAPLLMCVDHWRMVPAALRRQAWQSYRRLQHDPSAAQAHASAVQAAVDAVHAKARERQARRDAATPPLF